MKKALVLAVLAALLALSLVTPATANGYYSGKWMGAYQRFDLAHVPNYDAEDSGVLAGVLTDFWTDDPRYTCLVGETIYVWYDPSRYPEHFVVHNGMQGEQCTYVTLIFPMSL